MFAMRPIRKVETKAAMQVAAITFRRKFCTHVFHPGFVSKSSKTHDFFRKRRFGEHSVSQLQLPPVSARIPALTGMM